MNRKDCVQLVLCWAVAIGAGARASADPSPAVKLWPAAVVSEDSLRLRDVAELHDFAPELTARYGEASLGEAPWPGGSRIITLADLRDALATESANMALVTLKGASECVVRRPSEPVPEVTVPSPSIAGGSPVETKPKPEPGSTLREAIAELFDRELSAYAGRADLQFGRTTGQVLELSKPEYEFKLIRQPGPPLGLANLEVGVLRNGEELQRVSIVVNVAMLRDVVVARNPINKGATVEQADVVLVTRRFTRLDDVGVSECGFVVGLRAKSFIAAGDLVEMRQLERVPLVKRGQMVEVVSRAVGVTVKTAAKAAADGGFGEAVSLHIPGRNRSELLGRVLGPRRVELGDALPPVVTEESALAQGGRP